MFDRALRVLIDTIEAQAEVDALERLPYARDPDLALPAATPATELPYDGDVPEEIMEIARTRRARRRGSQR